MSKTKRHLIEIVERVENERLAKILGITYDEFISLDSKIETNESKDNLIYNYRIEFYEDSPKEILEKINKLEEGRRVYIEPWELNQEYDYDEQFDAITENKDFIKKYQNEIENLEILSKLGVPFNELKTVLNRQIFIGIIGAMETFLSDVFINLTFDNEKYFRNFIESHPEFQKRKFELREIFEQSEKLEETAKRIMLDTIYHNLPTVRKMYKDTFKIDFPDIKKSYELVLQRHDLVHRNGSTKSGELVITDTVAIKELIKTVNTLVYDIAKKLNL
ncbi:hypothetical protein [Lutibacter sp. B1]|uniref:hypothetical protein n=1 Tax=Lutibacter sp. B1 TaxID=2725996 RepID=UPI001B39D3EB|nr:hypothetical protein [Lutibacter sp. B1]